MNFDALRFPLIKSHVENLGSKISSDVPPIVAKDAFAANKRAQKLLDCDNDKATKRRKTDHSKADANNNTNADWLVDKKDLAALQ